MKARWLSAKERAAAKAVAEQLKEVEAGYAKAREDNLGDYALIQGLIDKGVHVRMTREEI